MGFFVGNIFMWQPAEVCKFFESLSVSGLAGTVIEKGVTGPQLLSMTPEEMQQQLGATPEQAQRIHAELNRDTTSDLPPPGTHSRRASRGSLGGHSGISFSSKDNHAAPSPQLSGAFSPQPAGVIGYSPRPSPQSSLGAFEAANMNAYGAATAGTMAFTVPEGRPYEIPDHAGLIYNTPRGQHPPPAYAPMANHDSLRYAHSQSMPYGAGAAGAVPAAMASAAPRKDDHTRVTRRFFWAFFIFYMLLIMVAGADLGLSIYLNGNPREFVPSYLGELSGAYFDAFAPHVCEWNSVWCALFFAAQGYTIGAAIFFIILQTTVCRNGSLGAAKWITSMSLLVAGVGLGMYGAPTGYWTYAIITFYDFSMLSAMAAAAIALEWFACLLWICVLLFTAVQLPLLCSRRYSK